MSVAINLNNSKVRVIQLIKLNKKLLIDLISKFPYAQYTRAMNHENLRQN